MHESDVHVAVEIAHSRAETADKLISGAENTGKVAKVISASHAFRKYDWLRDVPVHNVAGNLRGVVLSSRWRTAYDISVKYGKTLERYHLGTIASVTAGVLASADQILDIVESKDSWDIKAAKLGPQATAIAVQYLTGSVSGTAHLLLKSMQGYCNIAEVVTGKPLGTYGQSLRAMDVFVESKTKQITDGNKIYIYINTTINPKVGKMLGF